MKDADLEVTAKLWLLLILTACLLALIVFATGCNSPTATALELAPEDFLGSWAGSVEYVGSGTHEMWVNVGLSASLWVELSPRVERSGTQEIVGETLVIRWTEPVVGTARLSPSVDGCLKAEVRIPGDTGTASVCRR